MVSKLFDSSLAANVQKHDRHTRGRKDKCQLSVTAHENKIYLKLIKSYKEKIVYYMYSISSLSCNL
jgi:hypothetical protein